MEITQFRGFSELSGIEDPCFNSQWPLNSFDDQLMNMDAYNSFSYAPVFDHIHYKPIMEPSPRPSKQLKTSSWNSSIISSDQSMMNQTIHYGSDHSHVANQATIMSPKEEGTLSSSSVFQSSSSHVQFGNQNHHTRVAKKINTTPQDHIMAERKRREKLSQKFIALSALIPGLKKMDKASVLGDAIKYLKNLQEKVKTLEEQTKKRSNNVQESVVFVKRYEVLGDGGEISSSQDDQLPEIEARFSGKDVLIRVHCEKKVGIVEEILAEIEKLHLSVINTTALTFANYALDITVVATMDQEFVMTTKDLAKNLRIGLKRFM
nr:transcription factor bHLH18-like [Tanacetum cinerariifolium]